jgi:hypothetical protein
MNDLKQRVLQDYGQYMGIAQPNPMQELTQRYAEGGSAKSNVPAHEANLKAYEEALKNRPKIETEKYSYKGYPLKYIGDGKWEEDVPDTTARKLVPSGSGSMAGTIFGSGRSEPGIYNASGQRLDTDPSFNRTRSISGNNIFGQPQNRRTATLLKPCLATAYNMSMTHAFLNGTNMAVT